MRKNNYYVYLHLKETNLEPFYVGKGSKGRSKRFSCRSKYWNSTKNKYGCIVMTISDNLSEKESFDLEKTFIKDLKSRGIKLCNHTNGGDGVSGYKHTDESKRKMSLLKKGISFPCSEARRLAIIASNPSRMSGKNHTTKAKHNISLNNAKHWLGKIRSLSTTNKIKSTKIKNGDSVGSKNPSYDNTIHIFKHKNGMVEKCSKYELKVKYHLNQSNLSAVVHGRNKSHGGWSYLGNV